EKYPTSDLELATIVFALKIWRHYFSTVLCKVFTNQRTLWYIFSKKDLNVRHPRLLEFLNDYDVTMLYHLSKSNVVADPLNHKAVCIGSLAFLDVEERPFS
ncbi:hypothetical protein MTR67_001221, partial [Solanum verrucosum]